MAKKKTRGKRAGKHAKAKINISNKTLTAVICILAAICLVAGGIYIDTFHGSGMFKSFLSNFGKTETSRTGENISKESMAVDISSKATMAVFGEEFLLCTKDGVKYYAAMGDQKWSDTFNMTSPAMVQEGNYIAVGDMGGKTVRVYDRSGILYVLQAEGSPVQFALNESGYLSLITKNNDAYRVRIYNPKGTLLKERVEESSGVYPLCSDVSDDSRAFAVSYLDTTDISPIGRVVFFYIDAEESAEHTDSMFAGVEKTDEIIPVISYRKGGMLAAISDVNVYGIGADGAEQWSYPLENTIDQAALGNKEYIVLALGDSVADKDGREKGTVCWLDVNGKEKTSYETGESVTYLLAAEKGVVIGNDRSYIGVNHSGSEGWSYTAVGDLSDLIPMEKLNRVMTVGKELVAIYDMSKVHSGAAGQTAEADAVSVKDEAVSEKEETQTEAEPADDGAQNAEASAGDSTGNEE